MVLYELFIAAKCIVSFVHRRLHQILNNNICFPSLLFGLLVDGKFIDPRSLSWGNISPEHITTLIGIQSY